MTVLFRAARLAVALPGRALIYWLDGRKAANGLPPLGAFLRGCVHGFVWLVALMAFSMATMTPAPTVDATTPTAVRPAPGSPRPAPALPPLESAPAEDTGTDVPYVPVPDDDDDHDWDKPRICHRKWWC